jgi:hypothetical protein
VSASDLLADLARQGFSLVPEGGGIRVTPASRLTEELRHAIRSHKFALLTLLANAQKPTPARLWHQAEAEKLLADLRATVERINRSDFRGRPPALFRKLAADVVAIAEGHVRDHEMEAARGWDALELLRDRKRVLLGIAGHILAMGEQDRLGGEGKGHEA